MWFPCQLLESKLCFNDSFLVTTYCYRNKPEYSIQCLCVANHPQPSTWLLTMYCSSISNTCLPKWLRFKVSEEPSLGSACPIIYLHRGEKLCLNKPSSSLWTTHCQLLDVPFSAIWPWWWRDDISLYISSSPTGKFVSMLKIIFISYQKYVNINCILVDILKDNEKKSIQLCKI